MRHVVEALASPFIEQRDEMARRIAEVMKPLGEYQESMKRMLGSVSGLEKTTDSIGAEDSTDHEDSADVDDSAEEGVDPNDGEQQQ